MLKPERAPHKPFGALTKNANHRTLPPALCTLGGRSVFPGVLLPAFVGELLLSLWLIVKGVNVKLWWERVAP